MKRKYNWDAFLPLAYISFIIICDVAFIVSMILSNDSESMPKLRFGIMMLIINSFGVLGGVSILSHNVTFFDDTIKVRRPNVEPYSISLKRINKFVVSLNVIPKSKGVRLAIAADREYGHFVGNGNCMLSAILKLYPNIPVVVMYSGWRLGRKNAILLAKRGYLSEDQLKEVQKRFRLPDGFEKCV